MTKGRLNMADQQGPAESKPGRRSFLGFLGAAVGTGAAAIVAEATGSGVLAKAEAAAAQPQTAPKPNIPGTANDQVNSFTAAQPQPPPEPNIPGYDWTKHQWAFGVDAWKCIGCLRCVEACKTENNVALDAHHFRTWVERYVYLEGEDKAHIDSQADPVNIAASGSEKTYRFANRYKDAKVEKAFFVPKLCNHCTHPACVQVCPTGATFKTEDGVVLIDHTYCIGCQYCVQACPYGARYFNAEKHVSDKCTWCYHRITKGLQPACVEVCPVGARVFGDLKDKESPISRFIKENRVQVLRRETGNAPNVFYIGLDKEVV
jgi:tetrathionate reductase subunit B